MTRTRVPSFHLAVFIPTLWLLGCSTGTAVHAPAITTSPLPQAERVPYRLQAGDQLAIRFWGNAELDQDVLIRPDGFISLPFVDDVQAEGLSPAELDAELTRRYAGELTRPEITVMVVAVAQSVWVGGEVGGEGSVSLPGRMTLIQAIQAAGGLLFTARRRQVVLIRSISDSEVIARSIDIRPILSGANPAADIALQANDIIYVPRSKIENLRLFTEQYVYGLLPIQAVTTIRVLEQ